MRELGRPEVRVGDTGNVRYVGQSRALHHLPRVFIALGVLTLVGDDHGLLAGPALIALSLVAVFSVPWRFAVTDDGIALWFGFGKRSFLPRDDVVVQFEGGFAAVRRRGARGRYPLSGGLGEASRLPVLRAVLVEHGYAVTR